MGSLTILQILIYYPGSLITILTDKFLFWKEMNGISDSSTDFNLFSRQFNYHLLVP